MKHFQGIHGNQIHGLTKTKFYGRWRAMKQRCLYPKSHGYKYYNSRGIKICDKWMNFMGFYEDMYSSYSEELSLDRINNDGNYYKENCRWVTWEIQNKNRRNNIKITHNGKTQTSVDWDVELGFKKNTVQNRITRLRWSIKDALTIKPNSEGNHKRLLV